MPEATPTADLHAPAANPVLLRSWRLTVWISGCFALLLGLSMLVGHLGVKAEDPLKSPQLAQLKETLRSAPKDETTKQQIRELDLQLRQRYFRQLSHLRSGICLLFGGVAVFIFAVGQVRRLQKLPPMPRPKPDAADQLAHTRAYSRWAVAAGGLAIAVLLFVLSLGITTRLPTQAAELDKLLDRSSETATDAGGHLSPRPFPDCASAEELQQNWPRFRGVDGSGVSPFTNLPASWDAKSGANILWKTATPGAGFNSPIIWGTRIFFSGSSAGKLEVFCLDAKSGQLVWRQPAAGVAAEPSESSTPSESGPMDSGSTASTMATDGRRVYAMLRNGEVVAFSLEGKRLWSKTFGLLSNPYGHASSLATYRDHLIVQLDQGTSEEGKAMLYSLDGASGKVAWQRPRHVESSWSSPVVFESGGKAQIVALAVPAIIAYAANDGSELWKVDGMSGEVAPSPIFAAGLVLATCPSSRLAAIQPGGQGDVSSSKLVWKAEEGIPDITSPASNGELVFAVTSLGTLSCFDAKDGKKQWDHEFEKSFYVSPSIVGDKVYLFSHKGTAIILKAARQFQELFRTDMEDTFYACPAFFSGGMILKGEKQVWCIGTKEAK